MFIYLTLFSAPPRSPDIDYDPANLLPAGSNFKLACNASGVPPPSLTWTWDEDGSAISPASNTVGKYSFGGMKSYSL